MRGALGGGLPSLLDATCYHPGMTTVAVYPHPSDLGHVGPTSVAAFERVLLEMSRCDIVIHAARINALVNTEGATRRVQQAILALLRPTIEMRRRINSFAQSHADGEVAIAFRGQLLELMRWGLAFGKDRDDDGQTFLRESAPDSLLLALAMASEAWGARVSPPNRVNRATSDLATKLSWIRENHQDNRITTPMFRAFDRGLHLLRRLCAAVPEFEDWFFEDNGLALWDFLRIAMMLDSQYIHMNEIQLSDSIPKNIGVFSLESLSRNIVRKQEMTQFIAISSISMDDARSLFSTMGSDRAAQITEIAAKLPPVTPTLRNRPILATPDGRMVIFDPATFRDFVLKNPIYRMQSHSRRRKLIDAYGDVFEDYCSDWLAVLVSGDQRSFHLAPNLSQLGPAQRQIDALIRCGDFAILFEMKAGRLRDDLLGQGREVELLQDLQAKIGCASIQLAALAREHFSGILQSSELANAKFILPVVVVDDDLMDEHVEAYLGEEFQKAVGMAGTTDVHRWHLNASDTWAATPVLLTVAELESLCSTKQPWPILDALRTYSSLPQTARHGLSRLLSGRAPLSVQQRVPEPDYVTAFLADSREWFFGDPPRTAAQQAAEAVEA